MKYQKIILTVVLLIFLGISYYFVATSKYELSGKYSDFPIPRSAKLIQENEDISVYEWSKSSDLNGIPFSYSLIIRVNGWEKVVREGTLTIYEKDRVQIHLSSGRDEIVIGR
ncbi:hypothetical protein [Lysinibacillus sp. G4S2]|uniref:hypothetical protein n=1 Tax=Lysinibacillus sp. G4S2 TaxID=3055859 RepID=UPI0025A23E53|nr:hypothetical protein [Lysinibacillus sp. G4S2]MDM5248604.1 hypothetical protein [Lysinibacillus sp. G4S2]